MATPTMLAREFLLVLPSDSVVTVEELTDGDVLVKFQTCGGDGLVRVRKIDRVDSLDGIRQSYKPSIDAALHALWTIQ